ncbi:Retrovirus-related Pol polyprotein from transposon TNT 1-94 [Gossypium australe]|uniref:Retrovirus-related Pol polyprotein from transposon TNT 1-94 n=1 Tax=Gossypium australe TaxID=47621 RepID=A0A5B6WRS1_9ROSI|nr:Retrovirus-related Pol polyprotein from transposon TNT 1-94 [Gossypium australe]
MGSHLEADAISQIWSYTGSLVSMSMSYPKYGLIRDRILMSMPCPRHGLTRDLHSGDERIRGMQVLNLVHDFELQKLKESEIIKEYSERLLNIANKIRLLGSSLVDSRIVEKILVTLPKRFEATITALENTKDMSKITLAELLSSL